MQIHLIYLPKNRIIDTFSSEYIDLSALFLKSWWQFNGKIVHKIVLENIAGVLLWQEHLWLLVIEILWWVLCKWQVPKTCGLFTCLSFSAFERWSKYFWLETNEKLTALCLSSVERPVWRKGVWILLCIVVCAGLRWRVAPFSILVNLWNETWLKCTNSHYHYVTHHQWDVSQEHNAPCSSPEASVWAT